MWVNVKHVPSELEGVHGYTTYSEVFVSPHLNEQEAAVVELHEKAHVLLMHDKRWATAQALCSSHSIKYSTTIGSALLHRLWNIACDLEIAANIYTAADERIILSPFSRIKGGITSRNLDEYPGAKYAEEFFAILLERLYSWAVKAVELVRQQQRQQEQQEQQQEQQEQQEQQREQNGQDSGEGEGDSGATTTTTTTTSIQVTVTGLPSTNDTAGIGEGSASAADTEDNSVVDAVRAAADEVRAEVDSVVGEIQKERTEAEVARSVQRHSRSLKTAQFKLVPSLSGALDTFLPYRKHSRKRTYSRVSRISSGNLIFKGSKIRMKSPGVIIYVDCSGSFSKDKTAAAEDALKRVLTKYRSSVRADVRYFSDTVALSREAVSGGGTNYLDVLLDINQHSPDVAVIITDDDINDTEGFPTLNNHTKTVVIPIGCDTTWLVDVLPRDHTTQIGLHV